MFWKKQVFVHTEWRMCIFATTKMNKNKVRFVRTGRNDRTKIEIYFNVLMNQQLRLQ